MDNISSIDALFLKFSSKFDQNEEIVSEINEIKQSILNLMLKKNHHAYDLFDSFQPKNIIIK